MKLKAKEKKALFDFNKDTHFYKNQLFPPVANTIFWHPKSAFIQSQGVFVLNSLT